MTRFRWIVPFCLMAGTGAGLPGVAQTQTVVGRVVDQEDDRPLAGVHVRLVKPIDGRRGAPRSGPGVLTADDGAFRVTAPGPGRWTLTADLLGYGHAASSPLTLYGGDTLVVEVRMAVEPIRIDEPVVVLSRRSPVAEADEFGRRLRWGERTGFGHFIHGEDLTDRIGGRPTDLLRSIPGVHVSMGDGFGQVVRMRGGCQPAIYLDGMLINRPGPLDGYGRTESLDSYINIESIRGIEVYRGAQQPGGRFVDRSGCGVIVVWSKRGEYDPDRPFSWTRLLIGLGLAVGILLIR